MFSIPLIPFFPCFGVNLLLRKVSFYYLLLWQEPEG